MEISLCEQDSTLQPLVKGETKDEETSSETSVSSVDESFEMDDDSTRSLNAHRHTGEERDLPRYNSLVNDQPGRVRFDEEANVYIDPPESENMDALEAESTCWYNREDYANFKTFQNYLARTVSATAESEEENMASTLMSILSRTYEKCCSDDADAIDPSTVAPSSEEEQVLLNIYQDAEALFGIERTLVRTISKHVSAQRRELLNTIWDLEEQGAEGTKELQERVRKSCSAITKSSVLFARYKAYLTSQTL